MIALFVFIILVAAVVVITYQFQFDEMLSNEKELIIKDGLIRELIEKATINILVITADNGKHINVDGILITGDNYRTSFWFPYKVIVLGKGYGKRVTQDDWEYDVGYIRRYSQDYKFVKKLMKPKPEDIEQKQRQKLKLNK